MEGDEFHSSPFRRSVSARSFLGCLVDSNLASQRCPLAACRSSKTETRNAKLEIRQPHPTFFCKYVIQKGFKSFVLKVCETKGVTDAFLRKCVNLKGLGGILASFEVSRSFF